MHETILKALRIGIRVDGSILRIKSAQPGRFREEHNIELCYDNEGEEHYLLYMKIFKGRPPAYRPWVEVFSINNDLRIRGKPHTYFDSLLEDTVLRLCTGNMAGGARLFVEYFNDIETRSQLQRGFPPVLSRLGYKMFGLGFTWFKDWYFPEGFLEGNQKLQGEIALDDERRRKHLQATRKEAERFTQAYAAREIKDEYLRRALDRHDSVIPLIDRVIAAPRAKLPGVCE